MTFMGDDVSLYHIWLSWRLLTSYRRLRPRRLRRQLSDQLQRSMRLNHSLPKNSVHLHQKL